MSKPEALELAEYHDGLADIPPASPDNGYIRRTAACLRRLHAENETLRQQRDEIFTALVQISLLTHLGGEVAEYGDVVDAVRRLHAVNAELLEALKAMLENGQDYTATRDKARAAITKAEGEKT